MLFSFPEIVALLQVYKYLFLFPIAIVEGPIITVIAGFLVSHGYLAPLFTYIILILGDIFGDLLYYAIGYWGKMSIVNRWGRFIGITEARILKIESHFEKHSGKTLLFGKFSHVTGAPILIAAGLVKMPLSKFISINFLATLPKVLVFLIIGYYFGYAYEQISTYFGYATWAGIFIVAAIFLVYVLLIKFGSRIDKRL